MEKGSESTLFSSKGLTQLHQESVQWLSTIEFWKTEFQFFRKLISKNFLRVTLVDKLQELEKFDKKLKHINSHELEPLDVELKKHEHYLNKLESGDSDVDDVTYRRTHTEAAQKMLAFENSMKKFKLELFQCIEHVSD